MTVMLEPQYLADSIGSIPVPRQLSDESEYSIAGQRILQDITHDINACRLQGALDNSLLLINHNPDCISNYLRIAELLVAIGNTPQATTLLATANRLAEIREEELDPLVIARIKLHSMPTIEAILEISELIINGSHISEMDRYVPIAVDGLVTQKDNAAALALATRWSINRPDSPIATAIRIRELLRSRQSKEALQLARENSSKRSKLSIPVCLHIALIAAYRAGEADEQWSILQDLIDFARTAKIDMEEIERWILQFEEVMPSGESLAIHYAAVHAASGHRRAAEDLLLTVNPDTHIDQYVLNILRYQLIQDKADDAEIFQVLSAAFEALEDERTRDIASTIRLLAQPVHSSQVGLTLIEMHRSRQETNEAITITQRLTSWFPEDEGFRRLHAEILGSSGDRSIAIRELHAIYLAQEKAGKIENAITTLESMVKLSPNNLSVRNRLIDGYMRRGKLSEAIDQLVISAKALNKANRATEATAPLRRAVEIASMMSDWKTVEHLLQLLVKIAPEDTSVRHSAAATFLQHNMISDAIEQLQQVVRIAEKHDDPDDAIAALHQLLALNAKAPETYHKLGELLVSVGEYGQAERVYRRLSNLLPEDKAVVAKLSALQALSRAH